MEQARLGLVRLQNIFFPADNLDAKVLGSNGNLLWLQEHAYQ